MEKKFTSDELPLAQILGQAERGEMQLPDFQRGWVWDDDHIRSLLVSISLSYPIGAVMTLNAGNPDVNFKARVLEGVETVNGAADSLLLDGQQRLTSLFQALKSKKPVATRDNRGRQMLRHYYASINTCINPELDREEEGIFGVGDDRVIRSDFGRKVALDLSSRSLEITNEMFPLEIVLDSSETMDWQMAYLQSGPGDQSTRLTKWKKFQDAVITPFVQYHVPTIDLAKSTPKEAVCQVFEKVNTGGVTLTVFELLTATYAAENYELRRDWDARQERLREHELLSAVEGTAFLQIVSLLTTFERRRVYVQNHDQDDRVPAVSCKRRDILRLSLTDYKKWASVAENGLLSTVPFLLSNRMFQSKDLPYATQLIPLAAILGWLAKQSDQYLSQKKLAQWFWCGVLGEMYGGATETRFAIDVEDCIAWIEVPDTASQPRTIQAAQFQAERLLTLRTRNSAAYKGLYALQMKQGSRDFKTGRAIDVHAYMEDAIDIHHIFPRKWCDEHGVEDWIANSIVNKTALDAHTNRRIGGNSPSVYLALIESHDHIEPHVLDSFLRTHDIDPLAMRNDDFEQFFNQRFESQLKQVENAMGKPVNRSPDRSESPFFESGTTNATALRELIQAGESVVLELKSAARINLHTSSPDSEITWSIVKTIAGFMNSNGGTLIVGVEDSGDVLGIEQDYPSLKGKNRDGWELFVTTSVKNALGSIAATEIVVEFGELDEHVVARIDVRPGTEPTFAKRKDENREFFFVRMNNATAELSGTELLLYKEKRWPA